MSLTFSERRNASLVPGENRRAMLFVAVGDRFGFSNNVFLFAFSLAAFIVRLRRQAASLSNREVNG